MFREPGRRFPLGRLRCSTFGEKPLCRKGRGTSSWGDGTPASRRRNRLHDDMTTRAFDLLSAEDLEVRDPGFVVLLAEINDDDAVAPVVDQGLDRRCQPDAVGTGENAQEHTVLQRCPVRSSESVHSP